jgi:polyhydroxyalkanoate synthesis regulator phasin
MGRINPTVTKEAESIYNAIPHHKRGEYVSDAIIAKAQNSASLEARVSKLEKRVEKLEGEKE